MIRWRLANLAAAGARRLQRLGNGLERMAEKLWKPMPREEAVKLIQGADTVAVKHSLERLRRGLRVGVVPARSPLNRLSGWDLANLPTEILLDLYTAEVASGLSPKRRMPRRSAARPTEVRDESRK